MLPANSLTWRSFFYPLDAIHHWNRLYGRRGFVQYQVALPLEGGLEGLKKVLTGWRNRAAHPSWRC